MKRSLQEVQPTSSFITRAQAECLCHISPGVFVAQAFSLCLGNQQQPKPGYETACSEIDAQNRLIRATTPGNARLKDAGVAMRPDNKRP